MSVHIKVGHNDIFIQWLISYIIIHNTTLPWQWNRHINFKVLLKNMFLVKISESGFLIREKWRKILFYENIYFIYTQSR